MAFFQAWPYIPQSPITFFRGLFEICVKYSFFFFPLLFFIIYLKNLSMLANKLCFVLVHHAYIAHKNIEIVPVLSSILSYLFRFLENRA